MMKVVSCLVFLVAVGAVTSRATIATGQERPENASVIPLWANGAPGFEDRKDEPEQAQQWWVANIHNPSITAYFPPKDSANGAAVVICPGGGHQELVIDEEGTKAAQFLNHHGVAGFVLKYRLGRDKTIAERPRPYQLHVHARQDGHRAMRTVRSHAAQWGIDPNRIGIMGFSAGGEVASMVVFDEHAGQRESHDPIDQVSSEPNFLISIYPGGLGIPRDGVPGDAPPAFLLASMADWGHAKFCVDLLQKYQAVGRPVELHIFNQGDHGYNMGDRSRLKTIQGWPNRLADWLHDSGILSKAEGKLP